MPVGNDNVSAFAHLEQRVSYLLERLEASADYRAGNLGRVEDGLHDILRHLETQHASIAMLAEKDRRAAGPPDSGLIDLVKRELSDIRFGQTETGRHTQDSLEAVQNTLGHVVDRLAMIEGDLHTVRSAPVAPQPAPNPPRSKPRQPQAAAPSAPRWRRNQSSNCCNPAARQLQFTQPRAGNSRAKLSHRCRRSPP
jgi:localization factor PodJL